MSTPEVTVLIPHYKTLELTKMCLRSLIKFTDLGRIRVIVLDNGSKDESTEYLRTLDWITFVEREPVTGDSGPRTHCKSLDEGLDMTTTPYVLSIHTDTLVISPDWLDFLLDKIKANERIAGVGSWKLEYKPRYRRWAKDFETFWLLRIWYPLTGKKQHKVYGAGGHDLYLRSHCAMYRTDLLREYTNGFSDGDTAAGTEIHRKLVAANFDMVFIESEELYPYLRHLNHATAIFNPEIAGRGTRSKKQLRKVMRELNKLKYQEILADNALDSVS